MPKTPFVNFFGNLLARLRASAEPSQVKRVFGQENEASLLASLHNTQSNVHEALADSFDTPTALSALLSLIGQVNQYIAAREQSLDTPVCLETLLVIGKYVAHVVGVWGVQIEDAQLVSGWGLESGAASASDRWTTLEPVLTPIASLRTTLRNAALAIPSSEGNPLRASILEACDSLRSALLSQGIAFEDQSSKSVCKLLSQAEAQAAGSLAKKPSKEDNDAGVASKLAALALQEDKQRAKAERARISPEDLFKNDPEYGQLDESGIPTHLSNGEPLSKSARKKCQKEWELQRELVAKFNLLSHSPHRHSKLMAMGYKSQ